MTPPRGSVAGFLPPAVVWLISVAFLAGAYSFNPASGAMPILIGWAMVALTSLDLATRMRGRIGEGLARVFNPSMLKDRPGAIAGQQPASRFERARPLVAAGGVIVFVVAMVLVGVLPVVPVFTCASLRFGAGRRWVFSVAGGAGIVLLVWAVFARLLGLSLYPGLLFGGEW